MTQRPKDIGTAAETAVVRFLRENGWPHAERRALRGTYDCGDVTGCPGLVFEVKGGKAAKTASDGQVAAWLTETETERVNAAADLGVLVMARAGIGPANAGRWWAVLRYGNVIPAAASLGGGRLTHKPIRMHLEDAATLLSILGYGDDADLGGQVDVPDDGCDTDPWTEPPSAVNTADSPFHNRYGLL